MALFGGSVAEPERRRQAAQVTRLLGLLRAQGRIVKVQKTHRYPLSVLGRRVGTALAAAHTADVSHLTKVA